MVDSFSVMVVWLLVSAICSPCSSPSLQGKSCRKTPHKIYWMVEEKQMVFPHSTIVLLLIIQYLNRDYLMLSMVFNPWYFPIETIELLAFCWTWAPGVQRHEVTARRHEDSTAKRSRGTWGLDADNMGFWVPWTFSMNFGICLAIWWLVHIFLMCVGVFKHGWIWMDGWMDGCLDKIR